MTKNNNVPQIRFKGFTDTWEQREFGDVGSVSMCKRIFKDETVDDGEIPFYKIGTFGSVPDGLINTLPSPANFSLTRAIASAISVYSI